MAHFLHHLLPCIWTLLRYPHPPLNQSSYTIFSFHRLAGFLPHPASYFFAVPVDVTAHATELPTAAIFGAGYGAGDSS